MRKILKIASVVMVLVLAMASLAACSKGNSAMKAAAGTYKGIHCKFVGDADWIDETFSLELKADGKGVHHRDDLDIDVTWKLDGENFSMTETFMGATIEYTGTLKDGNLDIFNGDPADDWSYEYVYEKE